MAPDNMAANETPRNFEWLVRAYTNDLYRTAVWLCGDPALADDLVQETFTRAWKNHAQLRDEGATKAWLVTILRREFYRHIGKKKDMVEYDEVMLPTELIMTQDAGPEVLALRQAITRLPVEYREPITLQALWGFSSEEIAEMLDLTPQTVMTRTFRARKKLKDLLNDEAIAEAAS